MYREETHAPLNLPVTFQSLSPFFVLLLNHSPSATSLHSSARIVTGKKGPTRQARCQGNSIARQTNPINLFPTRFQDRGRWGRMVDGGDRGWIERVKEVFSVFPKALNVKRSLTFDRVSLVHGADILQRYPFLTKKTKTKSGYRIGVLVEHQSKAANCWTFRIFYLFIFLVCARVWPKEFFVGGSKCSAVLRQSIKLTPARHSSPGYHPHGLEWTVRWGTIVPLQYRKP